MYDVVLVSGVQQSESVLCFFFLIIPKPNPCSSPILSCSLKNLLLFLEMCLVLSGFGAFCSFRLEYNITNMNIIITNMPVARLYIRKKVQSPN